MANLNDKAVGARHCRWRRQMIDIDIWAMDAIQATVRAEVVLTAEAEGIEAAIDRAAS